MMVELLQLMLADLPADLRKQHVSPAKSARQLVTTAFQDGSIDQGLCLMFARILDHVSSLKSCFLVLFQSGS